MLCEFGVGKYLLAELQSVSVLLVLVASLRVRHREREIETYKGKRSLLHVQHPY